MYKQTRHKLNRGEIITICFTLILVAVFFFKIMKFYSNIDIWLTWKKSIFQEQRRFTNFTNVYWMAATCMLLCQAFGRYKNDDSAATQSSCARVNKGLFIRMEIKHNFMREKNSSTYILPLGRIWFLKKIHDRSFKKKICITMPGKEYPLWLSRLSIRHRLCEDACSISWPRPVGKGFGVAAIEA